jgi:hypothetical protein
VLQRTIATQLDGLIKAHKDEVTRLVAGRGGNVRWNLHLRLGSPVYDRFIKAISGLPTGSIQVGMTRMAFHGTGKENIEGILQHGMDPSRRKSQQRDCDWYGSHIDECNVHQYAIAGEGKIKNIIVFALLVHPHLSDRSGFTFRTDQVITGTKCEHALPLGVISSP